VKGGQLYGSTDRLGTRPLTKAVTPSNIHATIYRVLGIARSCNCSTKRSPVNVLDDPNRLPTCCER